jgi:hypothetical protein
VSAKRCWSGPIHTPLASRQSLQGIARIVSTIPMGRMGESDEVARRRCFWRWITPVSSLLLNGSLRGAEHRSNRQIDIRLSFNILRPYGLFSNPLGRGIRDFVLHGYESGGPLFVA